MPAVDDQCAAVCNDWFEFVHHLSCSPQLLIHVCSPADHEMERSFFVHDMELGREVGSSFPGLIRFSCIETREPVISSHHHGDAISLHRYKPGSPDQQLLNRCVLFSYYLYTGYNGAEPVKKVQKFPARYAWEQVLIPAGKSDNLMGEYGA